MGCIPSQRVLTGTGECLTELNEYVLVFNAAAKKMLNKLNAKLPGAQLVFADCYPVVMDLIDHPEKYGNNHKKISTFCTKKLWKKILLLITQLYTKHASTTIFSSSSAKSHNYILANFKPSFLLIDLGFKSSHTSCCNVDTTVGGLCLPNAQVCANRKDFVFWDAYHTSDAANQVIADKMFPDLKAVVDGVSTKPSAPVHASALAPAPAPHKWICEGFLLNGV